MAGVGHTGRAALVLALLTASLSPVLAGDRGWSRWRGASDGNGVSPEMGLPAVFDPVSSHPEGTNLRNVRWVTIMGANAFGSPVIAGGKVFIGGQLSDQSSATLWCYDESDGSLLWRMRAPFYGLVNRTWGTCATPTVDGDRVYLLGHQGELLCLDARGLAGRQPSKEDLELIRRDRQCTDRSSIAPDGRRIVAVTEGTPGTLEPTDAHVLWKFDLIREVNCWPYNGQSPAVLVRGDRLYVATGTTLSAYGKDGSKYWVDQWRASSGRSRYISPSLIVLDKYTGKLLATDDEGIFERTFHGANASPTLGVVGGKELLFYGGGDGTCYAFDPDFTPGEDGKPGVLRCVWKFDCVAADYTPGFKGKKLKKAEILATTVFADGKVYAAIGNDPTNSGPAAGGGRLLCIKADGQRDVTATGKIWSFDDIRSTCTTPAVSNGLIYTADNAGWIYCLDAETGQLCWQHQSTPVWSSILVADGRVYVAARDELLVFAEGREKRIVGQTKVKESMVSSPAAANGKLIVATTRCLYALESGKAGSLVKLPETAVATLQPNPERDLLAERDADTAQRKAAKRVKLTIGISGAVLVGGACFALHWWRRRRR